MYTIAKTIRQQVSFVRASCHVRYWEDATVNGAKDTKGKLIPLRVGDCWRPTIELATGIVEGWPSGTTASIHYKVCDEGSYELLDAERNVVASKDGYVPAIMCPGGDGYGDYVIMSIGPDGKIKDWKVGLEAFES